MKILHIISGLGMGGAENTLYNLVKFDKKNQHVIISLSKPLFFEKKIKQLNVEVFNFDLKKSFFLSVFYIIKILKKKKPDLLQCWMYHAELLSIIIKFFVPVDIYWNIRNSTPYTKSFRFFTRIIIFINSFFSYITPKKILSCSNIATKNHINIGYNKNIFFYIPNGIDVKKFCISRKKTNIFNIGCVARWSPQKDHLNLIKALYYLSKNSLKKWKCVLVGKNVDKNNIVLTKNIKLFNLGNFIKLIGLSTNIEKFYNSIDLLVVPSKDGEGFPNVILEAYASGVPCISTDTGDAKYIISNKKLIVDPNNSMALFKSIQKIMKDKKIFSIKNKTLLRKKVINKYSINSMIEAYNLIWKKKL